MSKFLLSYSSPIFFPFLNFFICVRLVYLPGFSVGRYFSQDFRIGLFYFILLASCLVFSLCNLNCLSPPLSPLIYIWPRVGFECREIGKKYYGGRTRIILLHFTLNLDCFIKRNRYASMDEFD